MNHVELLDSAHFATDSDPSGLPTTGSALALCEICLSARRRRCDRGFCLTCVSKSLPQSDGTILRHGPYGSTYGNSNQPDRTERRYIELLSSAQSAGAHSQPWF